MDSDRRLKNCLAWVDGKTQVRDVLTKLHGDGDVHPAVRFKDDSEKSALLLFCAHFVECVVRSTSIPLESVEILVIASIQTVVNRFANTLFTVPHCCSNVCFVLCLSSLILTTLSTLHNCNFHDFPEIRRFEVNTKWKE